MELLTESLFRGRTVSWINQYVTETSEEIAVASVGTEVQGNLSRRPDHDRHRL